MDQRLGRAVPILLAALLGSCGGDGKFPTAPDSPIVLENSELMSGGEGLLRSTDFTEFQLEPAMDAENTIVPNRWTNFRVEIDGAVVDSWRVESDAIGFRVPVAPSGTAEISVAGDGVLAMSRSVRLRGLIEAVRYDTCGWILARQSFGLPALVAVGEDAVLATMLCYDAVVAEYTVGSFRLVPPAAQSLTPVEGGAFTHPGELGPPRGAARMYVPGPTFEPGAVILERHAPSTDASPEPELWRARVGAEVELVELASCGAVPELPFAVHEVAEGICLTVDESYVIRRGEEEVIDVGEQPRGLLPPIHFVRSPDGRSLPINLDVEGLLDATQGIPVFDADGRLDYVIGDFGSARLVAADFSPSGAEMYLIGGSVNGGLSTTSVIERRSASTGELLQRRSFEVSSPDVLGYIGGTLAHDRLWVLQNTHQPQRVAVLHVIDADNLDVERSIYLDRPAVEGYPAHIVWPQPGSVVIPDASGRRAYIVTVFDEHLIGFVTDVF